LLVLVLVAGADAAGVALEGACAKVNPVDGLGAAVVNDEAFPPKLKPLVLAGAAVSGAAGAFAPKLNPPVDGAALLFPAAGGVVVAPKAAGAVVALCVPPKENPPAGADPGVVEALADEFPPFAVPPGAAAGAPKENAMVAADFCFEFLCVATMARLHSFSLIFGMRQGVTFFCSKPLDAWLEFSEGLEYHTVHRYNFTSYNCSI
jgi:hypothetical protein